MGRRIYTVYKELSDVYEIHIQKVDIHLSDDIETSYQLRFRFTVVLGLWFQRIHVETELTFVSFCIFGV